MNVECQTIRVPTGVQDYRPALHGGIAAIEARRPDRARRPGCRPPRARGTHRPGIHGRTKEELGHEQLGDHEAASRRRPAHLRLLRTDPRHGHRYADRSGARRLGRGRPRSRRSRTTRSVWRGVSTRAIDDLMARAMAAGATAAKVCGAGGGGCLFCYGPPGARSAIADALARGGARLLEFRIEMEGLRFE